MVSQPLLDTLFCDEEENQLLFNDFIDETFHNNNNNNNNNKNPFSLLSEHDLFWENEELFTLLSKETKQTHFSESKTHRNEAVKWMLRVVSRYGFSVTTALLAVNYYDRFITNVYFEKDIEDDKPWMSQLAAVACLSVAAKVEETQVPLLVDFQVEECRYLFEAKTIQRMEVLLLSTLKWRMNPVTPVSYFDHFGRRFDFVNNLHWEYLSKCESVVLSIIADCRLARYLPSIIAAAIMIRVIREIGNCDALEYENRIVDALNISKEKIDACYKLITEIIGDLDVKPCNKRKHEPVPSSPSGVIDAYFSSESSVDSWAVGSSVSSSPEPLFKRSRAQDQHMRLAPLSVGVRRG